MKKKGVRKLALKDKTTLRRLSTAQIDRVGGGAEQSVEGTCMTCPTQIGCTWGCEAE